MKPIQRKVNKEKNRHLRDELIDCAGVHAVEIESDEEVVITTKAGDHKIELKGPVVIIVNEL